MGLRPTRALVLKGRAFLVIAVYVASLALVAFGHCAPTFGLVSVAQAEHHIDDHHDCQHHGHDGCDHEQTGTGEDCAADLLAKGYPPPRADGIDVAPAKIFAVVLVVDLWRQLEPLVAITPERPPDIVPRTRSGYAQTFARTGRLIV